ncbi:MAG: hypothetical protein LBH57_01190 [Treponema sp.]|jgi:hypothetical protein|nr:hypothetical protein [Treponema sp.]
MNGGTISDNSATNAEGGGVFVYAGTFTMTGGIIYGFDENDPEKKNKVVNESNMIILTGRGHAVYIDDAHLKENTVRENDLFYNDPIHGTSGW